MKGWNIKTWAFKSADINFKVRNKNVIERNSYEPSILECTNSFANSN